jgi:hypothetical protein
MAGLPLAAQDYYVEQAVETPSFGGQPPQKILVKTWISGDKARMEGLGGMISILRGDQNKMLLITEATKAYTESDLDSPQGPVGAAAAMMGDVQVDVKPTGNTKKIGEWNCQEYLVTFTGGMPMTMQMWVCPDVSIDSSLSSKMSGGMGANPAMAKMAEKLKAIKGYAIQTVTKMAMGAQVMETTMTVQKISQEKIDPALFEVPAGYTKAETGAPPTPVAPAAPK